MGSHMDAASTVVSSRIESSKKSKEAEFATKFRLFEWSKREQKIEELYSVDINSAQIRPHNEDFLFATVDAKNSKKYMLYFRKLALIRNDGEDDQSFELIVGNYTEGNVINLSNLGSQTRKVIKTCSKENLIKWACKVAKVTFYKFTIDEPFLKMFESFRENLQFTRFSFHGKCLIDKDQLTVLSKWKIQELEFREGMNVTDLMLKNFTVNRSLTIHSYVICSFTDHTLLYWINNTTPKEIQINEFSNCTINGIVSFIKAVIERKTDRDQSYSWSFTFSEDEQIQIKSMLRQSTNLRVESYDDKLPGMYITNARHPDWGKKIHLRLDGKKMENKISPTRTPTTTCVVQIDSDEPPTMQNRMKEILRTTAVVAENIASTSAEIAINVEDLTSLFEDIPPNTSESLSQISEEDLEQPFDDLLEVRVNEIRRNRAASVDKIEDADHVKRSAQQVRAIVRTTVASVPPSVGCCSCRKYTIGLFFFVIAAGLIFGTTYDYD